jgi:type I restriction enzyme R subunit
VGNATPTSANFDFLRQHEDELLRLGALAERYSRDDPNTCLIKLRQFGEVLAQSIATKAGLDRSRNELRGSSGDEGQAYLLCRLDDEQITPREISDRFHHIRIKGNRAAHDHLWGTHGEALKGLKLTRELGIWFLWAFRKLEIKPRPFVPPPEPTAEMEALRGDLARLHEELTAARTTAERARSDAEEQRRSRLSAEERVRKEQEDRVVWEQLAKDLDATQEALVAEIARLETAAALSKQSTEAAKVIDLGDVPTRGILAELIRQFAFDNYIEPMRGTPDALICIRSGDVHKDMKLSARMPAVCSALDAKIFQSDFGLELVRRTGPRQGATVEWVFRARGAKTT